MFSGTVTAASGSEARSDRLPHLWRWGVAQGARAVAMIASVRSPMSVITRIGAVDSLVFVYISTT